MDKAEKYKLVYKYAKEFLKDIVDKHPVLDNDILERHLHDKVKFDNLSDANKRLIESLSNRHMMASVISFWEKESEMRKILCDYNPKKIIKKYSDGEELFQVFKHTFSIIERDNSKRSLWRQFAKGIISGSEFMSSFKDKDEFDKFVKKFDPENASLPMILKKKIHGFGLALACDFLKELGYRDYSKPDTHLIKIFYELGLCESSEPYEVYKSIREMAKVVGDDAYSVDKIFYLIGSGNFYLVEEIKEKVGRNEDKFIKEVKKKLK